MPPREPAFVHHVKALRRLVVTAAPALAPDAVASVVLSRTQHVLAQIAAEAAADQLPDDEVETVP
jgi:hypothetical protein